MSKQCISPTGSTPLVPDTLRQFNTMWRLTTLHLAALATEECLWRPARLGVHVHQDLDGEWRADWPTYEGYDFGPPSIAWLTWHVGFWWSMVLSHSFGDGTLALTGS